MFLSLCAQADEGLLMTGSKDNYKMVRQIRNGHRADSVIINGELLIAFYYV